MYNPSRGGVRGGADQFTWESVKTDKHRENYLGHSLKAPVGRWQKGKDLSWYAKERKEGEDTKQTERSELAAIKRAEEEAMLIALGHNVVRKESQSLTKEEMTEALKRNIGDRDQLNIERIDGVGVKSGRAALLAGTNRDSRSKKEGVSFETYKEKNSPDENTKEQSPSAKRSKSKKKSKKHKKEKKKRSHNKSETDDSEEKSTARKKQRSEKSKRRHDASDSDGSENELTHGQKHKTEKIIKRKQDDGDSYDSDNSLSSKRYTTVKLNKRSHNVTDSIESNGKNISRKKHKTHKRDSDSNDNSSSRVKHKKKSKYRHQASCNSDSDEHKISGEKHRTREHDAHPKRRRHDTSESD